MWDYPRPPLVEPTRRHLRVVFAGLTIAETRGGWRVCETSHPPVYYFPRTDVRMELLEPLSSQSVCEWKGEAVYFAVEVDGRIAPRAAWSYPNPEDAFAPIQDMIAFYARPMDGCFVDGEKATPQPGGFYGGWITSHVAGPFKGGPATMGW